MSLGAAALLFCWIVMSTQAWPVTTTGAHFDGRVSEMCGTIPRCRRVKRIISETSGHWSRYTLILQLGEQVVQSAWLHRHTLLNNLGA